MTLAAQLGGTDVTMATLNAHIEGLSPTERVSECVSLAAAQQKRLWEIANEEPAATAGALLPPGARMAIFAGRNSLRMFTRFEKCFAHQGTATVGYNRHALSWLVGPGYFTVEPGEVGGLRFDYDRLPSGPPPGWPAVAANTGTFSRPVYGRLLDRVVWVSQDVLIGSAYRSGQALDSYFVLARLPE